MALNLSILYRGPLSSCNYDCHYCPFAKHHETASELAVDRRQLVRFVDWLMAGQACDRISVFFTPWGEALTRRWYRDAMAILSHLEHVAKVAVQTNLSCRLDWLRSCNKERTALWCTYHPTQISRADFLQQCRELDSHGASYSVGIVGLKKNFEEIFALRQELAPDVYLWVNAFKGADSYYTSAEVEQLESIDPLFRINNTRHRSLGQACRTGETVISVDGEGNMRRCHFIKEVIGNIYDINFADALRRRACTADTCGCHIGYAHLEPLQLVSVFGDGLLERVPQELIWQDELAARFRTWATQITAGRAPLHQAALQPTG